MMKRMLLCVSLMGLVGGVHGNGNGNGLSAERVLGLSIGGSAVAAVSAYGAVKLMNCFNGENFSDRSLLATTGCLASGYAVWALSTQKFLEAFNVQKDYHRPMTAVSLAIGALVAYACATTKAKV